MTTANRSPHQTRPSPGIAGMSPAYFGLVMTTGIVSLGAFMMGITRLAVALFHLNVGQYALLCCCTACAPGATRGGSSAT